MERNCQAHIKVEHKGSTTVYWRCLEWWTTTVCVDGRTLSVCEEHQKQLDKMDDYRENTWSCSCCGILTNIINIDCPTCGTPRDSEALEED